MANKLDRIEKDIEKTKADTKGGDEMDEYDFGEDEDDEDEPTPEDEEPAQDKEE